MAQDLAMNIVVLHGCFLEEGTHFTVLLMCRAFCVIFVGHSHAVRFPIISQRSIIRLLAKTILITCCAQDGTNIHQCMVLVKIVVDPANTYHKLECITKTIQINFKRHLRSWILECEFYSIDEFYNCEQIL